MLNSLRGAANLPSVYHEVGENYGAGRIAFIRWIALPHALPSIMTGIRVAAGILYWL